MWRAGLLARAACGRLDFAGLPDCPDGFVGIAGNTALGTHSFCVMQFEARGNVQEWVDWTHAGITRST